MSTIVPGSPEGRLAARVAACLGLSAVVITPAPGGASNLAFQVFDPVTPGVPVAFLRCRSTTALNGMGYTLQREAALMVQAGQLGIPVATVVAAFDDPDSILMRIVPGTSTPDPGQIEVVGSKYMALVAAVHASNSQLFPVEQHESLRDALQADLAAWKAQGQATGVIDEPLLALATRVLEQRLPAGAGPPALVHGDVGPGNFMCLDGEVTAMLDWELAHLGDAHEDLAWLWMRGAHTNFGEPAARFAEYEAASATSIDPSRLSWNVAFVMWKSLIAIQARLRAPVRGELGNVQTVVRLTYDALLGAHLVGLLGGSLRLLEQVPHRLDEPEANLAEELLSTATFNAAQRVVVEYLRDSSAQSEWERTSLAVDCASLIGATPDRLAAHIRSCSSTDLAAAAMVVARHADRRAMAMPKAVRRIERARRIGLAR